MECCQVCQSGDTQKYLHVLVDLLPWSLVLQSGLCQVDGKDTGDPNNASDAAIDEFSWEAEETEKV